MFSVSEGERDPAAVYKFFGGEKAIRSEPRLRAILSGSK